MTQIPFRLRLGTLPVAVGTPLVVGRWTVSVDRVPRSAYAELDLSVWDVLKGQVTYYLPDAEAFQIWPLMRPKAFRLLPSALSRALPVVWPQRDSLLNPQQQTSCVRVTLLYADPETLQREQAEEAAYGSTLERLEQIARGGTTTFSRPFSSPR